MKRKLKARVLDRYPETDRHYYPLPMDISTFCFPSGINLQTTYGQPESFNLMLTNQDGNRIYCTCLLFDEDLSKAFQEKLGTYNIKNATQVRGFKALCIISHYSFNTAFKDILKQLYRMQISTLPMERYILNVIDEIPLPDEGKLQI